MNPKYLATQANKFALCLGTCIFIQLASIYGQTDTDITTTWNNGILIKGTDVELKFGGRILYDFAYFNQGTKIENAVGPITSGNEFRRIRFYNSGKLYQTVKYKLQFEFAGGEVALKDAYVEFQGIPVLGKIRVGHFKEPFRLESLTSSKYILFMERSFNDSFVRDRNTGLMFFNEFQDKRIGAQLAIFRNGDNFGDDISEGENYNITARLTGLILRDKSQNKLLHVGFAFTQRSPKGDTYRIRHRPSSHLAPRYISTSNIENITSLNMVNFELSLVLNSFSFQSEILRNQIAINNGEKQSLGSYYGQISYFITGESRNYKDSFLGFGSVKPKKNLGGNPKGSGAWELALRFASVDLNDVLITGGAMNEWTLGVNWYVNPATRVSTNYVLANVDLLDNSHIWQIRFQVAF